MINTVTLQYFPEFDVKRKRIRENKPQNKNNLMRRCRTSTLFPLLVRQPVIRPEAFLNMQTS